MNSITELARMLKERENPGIPSIAVGKVVSPPPEVKISLNDVILLTKEHLVFSAGLIAGYAKEANLTGDIQFNDSNCGTTNSVHDGGYQASSHSHTVASINIDTTYSGTAKIEFTDTLKAGDEVMIMPTTDEQTYYVLDKVVRL